jgi:uncharacterized repeat protein (TIGR04138 family)
MSPEAIEDTVHRLSEADGRFRAEAFVFVLGSLEYARLCLRRDGHVSARELILGTRDYGRSRFGPLAPTVFRAWGVHATLDFGHIVMILVDEGILSLQEGDTLESFAGVYDLDEAFARHKW